jgi:hypothetical protein
MPKSSGFPTKNVYVRAICPAHFVVTLPSFTSTANPHNRNIQYVLYFAVQVSSKTFFTQKTFSELGSVCEQKRVQVFSKVFVNVVSG